jgi:hypothetical protein
MACDCNRQVYVRYITYYCQRESQINERIICQSPPPCEDTHGKYPESIAKIIISTKNASSDF